MNNTTDDEVDLTDEEHKAIESFERLAKKWPSTLWLFSASGSLCVMKYKEDGQRATVRSGAIRDSPGVDPEYVVATILIDNDGGDW